VFDSFLIDLPVGCAGLEFGHQSFIGPGHSVKRLTKHAALRQYVFLALTGCMCQRCVQPVMRHFGAAQHLGQCRQHMTCARVGEAALGMPSNLCVPRSSCAVQSK
jgi:hypothetical protein